MIHTTPTKALLATTLPAIGWAAVGLASPWRSTG